MTKLRAAIIGCGGAGRNHAIGYQMQNSVELVAMVDVFEEKAQKFSEEFGGKSYDSYEEMILQQQPDIVSVCTREYFHVQPVIYALSHGSNVLCEKILAHDLKLGEQMVSTADQHGKLLGVNYNYRFIDSIKLLKEYIGSGKLGDLRNAVFNVHVFCHHHTIDLLTFLFGEPDEIIGTFTEDRSVRDATLWNDPEQMLYVPDLNACTVARFGNFLATINAVRRPLNDYPLLEIQLNGSQGSITIADMMMDGINGTVQIHTDGERRQVELSPLTLDGIFFRSIAAWVESVQGIRPVPASGVDALKNMRLEHAISRSHFDKKFIDAT